jgi:hypothetical protein
MKRLLIGLTLFCAGVSASTTATAVEMCEKEWVIANALDQALATLAPEALAAAETVTPVQKQATAPVGPAQGAGGAPGPDRPSWVSFAIEQGYATPSDDGSVTISLSPFDWIQRGKPQGYFDASDKFHETLGARKWTGSLTFGSPGVALDTDQDGVAEDPASVKSLTDSSLLEIQYQLKGSNDRRDILLHPNSAAVAAAVQQSKVVFRFLMDIQFRVNKQATEATAGLDAVKTDEPACAAALATVKDAYLKLDTWPQDRETLIAEMAKNSKAIQNLANEIDKQPVVTLAVSVLERQAYLGPDRLGISLRSRWGTIQGSSGFTQKVNLDVSREDALVAGQSDLKAATLTYEYVRPATRFLGKNFDGATWALNLSGEKNWNAPANAKKSKAVLGLALNVPVNETVTIPFSLTWANRDEFLKDNDEVIGHVGLSFNFDAFKPK